MIILCYNCSAFKNRIQGKIQDQWLSLKTFETIIHDMIMVLEDLVKLKNLTLECQNKVIEDIDYLKIEDWQLTLLDLLKSFI